MISATIGDIVLFPRTYDKGTITGLSAKKVFIECDEVERIISHEDFNRDWIRIGRIQEKDTYAFDHKRDHHHVRR